jgi:hypothetical protein
MVEAATSAMSTGTGKRSFRFEDMLLGEGNEERGTVTVEIHKNGEGCQKAQRSPRVISSTPADHGSGQELNK